MSKIKTSLTVSNTGTLEELRRFTSESLDQVVDIINGGLNFSDNLQTSLVSATFTSANNTISVVHTLGTKPIGYITVGRTTNLTVFDGSQQSDANRLYVQASAAGTAKLLVFA